MNICFLCISLLLRTKPDLEGAGLVVCAVGAGHQFFVFALERKPRLKIKLLGCSVVQCPGDDGNNLIREPERLVECLGRREHVIKCFPRLLWVCEYELLDLSCGLVSAINPIMRKWVLYLLELMNTINAPGIASM